MDFGSFGDGNPRGQGGSQEQSPPVNNTTQQQQQGSNSIPTPSGDDNTVFMHTMEHPGVFCDICEGIIRGFRYKCMQCADFDLCSTCERKGHHAGHIMMRISFPEQTRDAIRRYLSNAPVSPPPERGCLHPGPGFPFGGHPHHKHGRRGHRSRHEPETGAGEPAKDKESEGESGGEERLVNGCPYYAGKKGMKKWAKCMKKMSHQHRRSAEAYAKSCGHAAANAAGMGIPTATPPNNAENERQNTENQFDFTSAASQIQEFLNAFGIPIDVVELYDNFGNRGQPSTEEANRRSEAPNATNVGGSDPSQAKADESTTTASETPVTPVQPPTSAATVASNSAQQAALAAHFGQLHLNVIRSDNTAGDANRNDGPSSAPSRESLSHPITMDLDGEASGWTLVENELGARKSPTPTTDAGIGFAPASIAENPGHVTFSIPTSGATSLDSDMFTNGVGLTQPTMSGNIASSNAPVHSTGTPGANMYPVLNPPQLQQLLNGVSQAVNSVVRNIPIITNPSGPGIVGIDQAQSTQGGQQMDGKSMTTLNQLLAMGFSNHDGWLSRLVIAKKGDLEAVLNALFPTNPGT